MNINYKLNIAAKWRQILTAVCLAAFLLIGLPATNAQSGNLPILFFSEREGIAGHGFAFPKIYGMNTDGSNQTRIGDANVGLFARYSPDGSQIVFGGNVDDPNSPIGFRQLLLLMNADGTNVRELSNDPQHHQNTPAWSPDGRTIAFTRTVLDFSSGSELWVMDANGDNQRLVYDSPGVSGAFYPSFSPDSSRIAFSDDRDGDYEIYVINVDGTNLRQLTNNTVNDNGADWSSNGKIAFNRERVYGAGNGSVAGNGDIYVMNDDGTNQTRLTKHGNVDFYPIWSPDNTQIVFSRGSRNADVYKMNADGSNVVRLTHEPGLDIASDWK